MIIVCPLHRVQELADAHGARHVVSLLSPDTPHRGFRGIPASRHLKLTFHDIAEEADGFTAPAAHHAGELMSFIRAWDRRSPLLIHCWAGISRSTAAAFTAMCMIRTEEDESALARELRAASPSASPNPLLVAHADRLLGRGGRMVHAIRGIGRGADAFEGAPFFISSKEGHVP